MIVVRGKVPSISELYMGIMFVCSQDWLLQC